MIIAVDFDGTITKKSAYPAVGTPNTSVIDNLKRLQDSGHKIILWTQRTGIALSEAIALCADNDLVFDSVNKGVGALTESAKIYADYYVDTKALSPSKLSSLK